MELTIIYLGGVPPRGVIFREPGPSNNARWMSTAIYTLKEMLFRKQVKLPRAQFDGLLQVAIFVVRVYIRAWFTATDPAGAPRNDLRFLQDMIAHQKVNKRVSQAAVTRFMGHTWYLTEINVGLALFDDKLPVTEKEKLVMNMRTVEGAEVVPKKRELDLRDVPNMTVGDLATKNTFRFFEILGLQCEFLNYPVTDWPNREDYIKAKKIVSHLPVVNDHSERAVRLFKEYNKNLTKKEKSYQDLLVTVHEFRKTKPDNKKSTLVRKYDGDGPL